MKTISKKKLLEYIKCEEIAFQFIDGLLCITHPNESHIDDVLVDDIEEMKKFLINSHNFDIVQKQDVITKDDKLGFNEFANWTIDEDLLILVDEELILCLPDIDTRKIIFNAA